MASDDAFFGIPEVDRGALGAATHLARMVPPHLMRTLYFTGRNIKATDLVQHGSVLEVVPRDELDEAALVVAREIARKDTRVIRMAKEALNGIDPIDVNKSYRFEQGFTMELNLAGVSDELRDAFVNEQGAGTDKAREERRSEHAQQGADRRGGRRSHRGRDDRRHRRLGLAAQADGPGPRDPAQRPEGPHDRVVRRPRRRPAPPVGQGEQGRVRLRDARLDPARAAVLPGPPGGDRVVPRVGRGHVPDRLRAAAQRVPFLPMRAGLGSAVLENDPTLKTVTSPYDDGEELVAVPALELDVALVHMNRADQFGNAQYLGPDPYFDDLFCMAAKQAYVSTEQIIDTAGMTVDAAIQTMLINRTMVDGVVETPNGAHFTTCTPTYERDEKFQKAYATAAKTPEDWAAFEERFLSGSEQDYQDAVAAFAKEQA